MNILNHIAVSEKGLVINTYTGELFTLNNLGIEIINLLKQGKSKEEIINFIISNYDVDENTLNIDFYKFVELLEYFKIIE